MRLTKYIGSAALFFLFSANLFAAQITGTVTNGTTNKPSAGDDVVLLSLSGGMDEVARTKTDAQGRFTLNAPDATGQSLVRVDHQGVNYFQPAPQGANTVNVTVYDAAKKVDNIINEGHVYRFQTTSDGQLEVFEMFVLRNESSPPRTKMGDRSFDFDLPAAAKIEDGMAEGPGGMPTSNMPIPAGKKDRYGFVFPIRPGRNRLQVTYKVPYAGTREFKVTPPAPLAELGIMLPKSMQFKSSDPGILPAQDDSGMTVFVAKSLPPGKEVRFSVSGQGVIPADGQGQTAEAAQQSQPSAAPGGGLGAPNQSPDPLSSSRWYIIAIFTVVLAGAGYWLFRMQRGTITASAAALPGIPPQPSSQSASKSGSKMKSRAQQQAAAASSAGSHSGSNGASAPTVLDAIKEELFQLESDRLLGKVSQQDYESSKAGLEMLIRRHLKRS